jgi:hypothetical protein
VATKAERLRSRDPGAEGGRHVGYPTLGSDRVRGLYIALVKYLECIKKQRQRRRARWRHGQTRSFDLRKSIDEI